MTDEAKSPLRRRMIEDMTIRKFALKTQHDYVQRVKNFAAFLGRSPDTATFEDVRRYQLHLAASGVGVPTSLIHPGRDAIFWVLERKPDRINYVAGWSYVYTDVWKGIEAETGKPIVDPAHKPILGKRVEFCPSMWGGKDWLSAAYSQKTGLVYVPANENFCGGFSGEKVPLDPGKLWLGTKPEDIGLKVRPGADHYGELQAWDPATGKKVWQHNFPKSHLFGSVLATAGDLVFAGGTNDRNFRAFDAKTGELLWEQKTNSGIMGMPVAYEVDGTEYIAIQSGWGVDAQRIQDALTTNNIGLENNVPQGGVVWVFAVKK